VIVTGKIRKVEGQLLDVDLTPHLVDRATIFSADRPPRVIDLLLFSFSRQEVVAPRYGVGRGADETSTISSFFRARVAC